MLPASELPIDSGPDARPKIVVGKDGALIVTFATRDDKYNGHGFITRSVDDGATFSAPEPITQGSPSQRFETAAVDADGHVFVAWLDKRNGSAARARGEAYAGAALAFAWDKGGPARCRRRSSPATTPANAAASPSPSRLRAGRSSPSATSSTAACATTPSSPLPIRRRPVPCNGSASMTPSPTPARITAPASPSARMERTT
ncbi:MAG: hypothetical protein WDN31_21075 [Hyphomicrobium sp.]